ncbi:hypothetical protein GP486_003221 [Trichoglossum hirsutum]|uniref:Restriction endonuclease domain-containing protein n=1 Tax=Trichoglossum hirsutum TaxID=265104 RepID=A0A9P8RQY1_9PEZI|nr:hypothetical protein GP486_003221 [Trichoglossum hirsutum]
MPNKAGSTPPDKTIQLPPSPPPSSEKQSAAVWRVLNLFQSNNGKVGSPWINIPLSLEDYEKLQKALGRDKTLRYDYDPGTKKITIRMPTPTHDLFIAEVVKDILFQLQTISRSPDEAVAEIARDVKWQNMSFIQLGQVRRSPDASFRHKKEYFPRIVIEVSYSQKRNDLLYLADDYITESKGNIGMVIGLDIEYRRTKEATVSIWRPGSIIDDDGKTVRICEQTLRNDRFRSEDGSAVEGSLVLQLGDFVLPQVADRIAGLNIPITITYNSLAQYLEEAESAHRLTEMDLGRKLPLAEEEWRKRKRTPTPPLSDDQEKKFQEAEARANQQMSEGDSDWGEWPNKVESGSKRRKSEIRHSTTEFTH